VALLVGVLVVAATWCAGTAGAQERSLTRAEAAALARQAETSDAALSRLRSVTSIDGRPVDLSSALAGLGNGAERRARLAALARELGGRGAPGSATSAARARADAHAVVSSKDYRKHELPKPFRGVLMWLRDRLAPVGRLLVRIRDQVVRVFDAIPGGRWVLAALLGGLLVVFVAWLAGRTSGARIRTASVRGEGLLVDVSLDPDELRRQAEQAESAGDFDAAVHLRFTEGVVRLVRSERIQLRAETTATRVAADVGGPDIRGLVTTFEEVVYGGRAATAEDCANARAGWAAVLGTKVDR
jgi:hypothetical protein